MKLYEMEGFLRGKCIPGDMKVNETNAEYLVRKFSEADSEITSLKKKLSVINSLAEAAEQASKLAQEATEKLVQERNALAAENAGLKAGIRQASEDMEAHHDDHGLFSYDADGEQMDSLLRLCDAQDSITSLMNSETPATDAFLSEVRAQGVEEFLRGSQLPYQIATVLADYDNVDDATLQTVIWSGQPPEPDGDVWHLEYVSRGNAIVHAVLKELRKGVQS
ncbi:hypothetical protein [Citrobacter amalonaticus]|uniref:hypothetical protein n=1 Tax=Citrobacter amalonaticus TaxID=35703 RepID=UPI00190903BD|nr:hypothetical protein [Citrobacter amalonaticus]MBJ9866296.1 hypothetical protein [Citrobacter amalonaticus]